MKKQIKRLSPHQNGKVIAVISALSSLPFFLIMFLMMQMMPTPAGSDIFPSYGMLFIMPIIHFIFGYIFVALGCVFYNLVARFVGGLEYETIDKA